MNKLKMNADSHVCSYIRPSFLIIGVQKAGTTTLFDLLSKVPKLCGSDIKETGYFSKRKLYDQGEDWYSQRFKKCNPGQISFEATPAYIYHPDAPARIYSFNPQMKFIVVFREPVARCYSAWNMFRRFNKNGADAIYQQFTRFADDGQKNAIADLLFTKDFPSFRQAIEGDIDRYKNKSLDIEPSFVRRGIYHEQLARYLNLFAINTFLFIEQNELNDIKNLCFKLSNFLGFPIAIPTENLIESNVADYETLTKENASLLNDLREFYAPHNEKLFELIDRRFTWN
jgi:hypothetical protein